MTVTVTTNLPTPSFCLYCQLSLLEFPVTLLLGRLVGKRFRAFLGRPASWSLRDRPVKSLPSMFADPLMLLKRSTSLLLFSPQGAHGALMDPPNAPRQHPGPSISKTDPSFISYKLVYFPARWMLLILAFKMTDQRHRLIRAMSR